MADHRKTPLEPETIEPHHCSIDLRLDILGRVPFFTALRPDELAAVNRIFRDIGFEAGETIIYAGDPAERLFVIASGKVKLLRHSLTGKNVLLDLLTPGELFGSLSSLGDETYPDTAQAQTQCCVLSIGADDFRRILDRYPSVTMKVLEYTAERLKSAHEMVRQISALPVEQRVAHVLLKLADKLGQPGELGVLIQTPLSREDLAEMTGATTETVSRIMSQFQRDGLVQSGRQWVAVIDRPGLERLVQED